MHSLMKTPLFALFISAPFLQVTEKTPNQVGRLSPAAGKPQLLGGRWGRF